MRKTEMEWRDNLNEGNEIKDIIINIEYIYTNMRPNIIKINYTVDKDYTNYKVIKIFRNIAETNN